MRKLPRITGREAIRAFEAAGFHLIRISGSHHVFGKDGHPFILSVPVHSRKILGKGLLKALIKDARLTVEEFKELLK